jgi:hypothetical protein
LNMQECSFPHPSTSQSSKSMHLEHRFHIGSIVSSDYNIKSMPISI